MDSKTINSKYNQFLDIKHSLFADCKAYIEEWLKQMGADKVVFADIVDEDDFYTNLGYPSVTYDGGNHPEYATNVYSTLYGVGYNGHDVYLIIEDSDEYELSRVWSIEDIVTVIDCLEWCKDNKKSE